MARRSSILLVLVTIMLCAPRSFAVRSLVQMEQQAAVQQPANPQATLPPKQISANPKPKPTAGASTVGSQKDILGELASDAVKAANEARAIADEDAEAVEATAAAASSELTGTTAAEAAAETAADAAVVAAAAAVPAVTGAGAMVLGTEALDGIADVAGAGSSAEAADAVAAVAASDMASAATDAATDVAAHAAESAADEASDEENDLDSAEEARKKALEDAELVWHKCVQSEKLGEVCVGVFVDSQQEPPLLFSEISLRNHTFLVPLAKAKACLDDQLLLNLLLHDPKLAPFAAEIKAIMIMEKLAAADVISRFWNSCILIPFHKSLPFLLSTFSFFQQSIMIMEKLAAADVISECVLFNGLSITVDKPNDCLYISACPRLCSRLGCRRGHCLYSKDKEFECFRVRVPLHKHSRDVAVR
ncbi:unnamed protein product [Closterium sp. Naga37s-1]|nr:unnamed protein product [Closterium sp. Naga37s-1]